MCSLCAFKRLKMTLVATSRTVRIIKKKNCPLPGRISETTGFSCIRLMLGQDAFPLRLHSSGDQICASFSCRCTCGHCRPMSKPLESKCCREIARVDARVPAGETCITAHPTFTQGVLNIHALEIAYCWFMEDRPGMVDEPEIHRYFWTCIIALTFCFS